MNLLKKIFLNDKIIMCIIFLNAFVIFLQESNINYLFIQIVDIGCTLTFLVEMIIKHIVYGVKGYWKSAWNRFDGILVILSLPSLGIFFISTSLDNLSILLVLRLLRVLRFFRIVHIFPKFSKLIDGFKLAMRQSYAILLSFFSIILICSLINCALFKNISPDYFSTPLNSIYSVFRICTIEGWYDIPDSIATATAPFWGHFVRLYFCLVLLLGGIIGMSFLNSVFVDAMVSDNNNELNDKIDSLEAKIDLLLKKKEENKE